MGSGGLVRLIGDLLREKGWTLSVAESCTGGRISDRITDVAGSSDYFEGAVVSYSNKAKAQHLGIPLKNIERYGAVSPQVARRMAEGVRKVFKTTFGLSTTGMAGPTGGTKKTPVGTVFIAVADEQGTVVEKLQLKGNRREVKEEAAERCLRLLWEQLSHHLNPTNPSTLRPFDMLTAQGERLSDCFYKRSPPFVVSLSNHERRCDTVSLPEGDKGEDSWLDRLRKSKHSEIVLIHKAPKGIKKKGRLGIFPASFNPPTVAHLALIQEAKKRGQLDEILILLDIQAMDKEPTGAGFEDRLAMLRKAFGRDPKISIGLSNRGLFLEKIKPLRIYYPPPVSFFFIVGFDTIIRVLDKKYYQSRKASLEALFSQCQFLVANRGEYQERALEILFRRREIKAYKEKISFIALPERFSAISSTLVRERMRKGRSVNGLVPVSILRYIREKGLYFSSSFKNSHFSED